MKDIRTLRMEIDNYYKVNIINWFREIIVTKKDIPECFPIHLYLDAPKDEEVVANTYRFLQFCNQWQELVPAGHVEFIEKSYAGIGKIEVPLHLVFNNVEEIAKWSGHLIEFRCAIKRLKYINEVAPELIEDALMVISDISNINQRDFECLIGVSKWILENKDKGTHLIRQIPVRGADLRWFESYTPILKDLLLQKLNLNPIRNDLFQFGLVPPPQLMRIYILDTAIKSKFGGLSLIATSTDQLMKLNIKPMKVVLMESLTTAMSLPEMPGTVVVIPNTNAIANLAKISWITNSKCYYLGSIDYRSFTLLHNIRVYLPNTTSMFMSEKTLLAYKDLWTTDEVVTSDIIPSNLTDEELKLCYDQKEGFYGDGVRLDLERIPLDDIIAKLTPKNTMPVGASEDNNIEEQVDFLSRVSQAQAIEENS